MARNFPDWLAAYMKFTEYSEAPALCHFWTGVSTLAAVLRRKVILPMGFFDWTPNFYIIIVGPAGIITKSTTANIGLDLLQDIKGVSFGANALTPQTIPKELVAAREILPHPVNGFNSMSCLTFFASELGSLLDPRDQKMMDWLTDLWDGRKTTWKKDTVTQGTYNVVNPWINILACTTRSWLDQHFPRVAIGGGFTSRCVLVYGDRKRRYIAYPNLSFPQDHKDMKARLRDDLVELNELQGEFMLDADAIQWGEEWYKRHWQEAEGRMHDDQLQGYLGRKQTHVHKLAMVLSVSRDDSLIIDKQTLQRAEKMVTALEPKMHEVFSTTDRRASPYEKTARVEAVIARHQRIPSSSAYREVEPFMSSREFDESLRDLMRSGKIGMVNDGTTKWIEYLVEVQQLPSEQKEEE